ncbi:DoxX family membrane protein [Geomonas sp. RF6]|uniref:DoxX family membrane protein n=1 Tax=Geomonas sp. RF6 TaxID=2897342 RepID=UPI001E3A9D07|nr:DoxX family membrane protein [Geomonas sp. RF6]UFS69567.1 DoxX family membrane protein [Geomonas sp. RF6]
MSLDPRRFFLLAIRIYFGIWLLYVGLTKWILFGPANFIAMITTTFDKTWSPHLLNVALAWLIMIAEPLLAVLILCGRKERAVWTAVSLFLFMLTMGQTILMKPDVIANWQYLVLAVACAALSEPEPRKQRPAQVERYDRETSGR